MGNPDVIVIGAGHNGLIAATLFAKAGLRTLVLERSDRVGGCARTSEIAPGFRCPALAHTAAIDPEVVARFGLARHGLHVIRPESDACAPSVDGPALTLWRDPPRAAKEIATFSPDDAANYSRFLESFRRISAVLRVMFSTVPPCIDTPSAGDLVQLLKAGRAFRSLGRPDAYRLLRWLSMPVADLVAEWFATEPLRVTIAAGGVLGAALGPRSAGSAAVLLLLGASEGQPVASGWLAQGGPGSIANALAAVASKHGVEIRTSADVARIEVADAAARAVVLTSGDCIAARDIVSGADPKRTFGLVDPQHFEPAFVRRAQNLRARGALAKVNYALSGLPRFSSLRASDHAGLTAALSGRIRLARDIDAIERAFDASKYGGFADEPWIELTIPSIADPGLAPANHHVASAYVQYAPYRLADGGWDDSRDRLGDAATATISRYAPGFESLVVAREVITPLDLERTYGLTGGDIFHGELALDQWFITRPLLGFARYSTPIRHLFLCGSGTHPGTGLNGRSGAMAAKQILRVMRQKGEHRSSG
jgi:phytoene dehydrogenase-like protein